MGDHRSDPTREVCILGMGYVGSSLAAVLAEEGVRVHGVDIDSAVVETIQQGHCPIEEDEITELFEAGVAAGQITATDSFERIDDCGTVLVTVGTPLAASQPDTSAVESAAASIGAHLDEGDTVIFRSTLPAGTTENTIRPILDRESGLRAGEEYALAFCPERMAEGSAYADLTSLPVVVGGYTASCQAQVEAFWTGIGQEVVSVSSPTAAELTKLADNWWIDLNIALANEIALLAEKLGVDAMEVITAANTLPKGQHNVNILYPGAGVGGSCLVKDPRFVANLGDELGLDLETPRVSRQINEGMPGHVVDLVEDGLETVADATVAVLGYAFKAGTDDTRNTPASEIITRLQDAGATVCVTDPYVPTERIEDEVGIVPSRLPDALAGVDAVVVVTGHDQYRSLSVSELTRYVGDEAYLVVDGRFVFEPAGFAEQATTYRGVGRGDVDG